MIRAVVDTSVLIRYLIRPSAAIEEIIEDYWINGEFLMISSPELVAELEDVLGRGYIQRFIQPDEGQVLLEAIYRQAEMIPSLGEIPRYSRDAKDDKFIAYAIAGQAGYVVTTDNDILALGSLADVQMATPEEFVEILRVNVNRS
jgi:putative PIN family toxin of toxin-antitoxin system